MPIDGFLTPAWFALLAVVAAIVVGYVLAQRRRKRHVLRFANLDLLERVAPKRQRWPRHVPVALFAVAFILLVVGLAGPTAETKVPRNRATVMLTVDISNSMIATDIQPSRIKSAQASAKSFVQNMTPGVNLGLLTFGGSATVNVSPITDRKPVLDSIDAIKLLPGTATGDAIAAALQAVDQFGRIIPGGPPPAAIVLMSDGKQTVGRNEFDVAAEAAKQKIPIYAISFGTAGGVIDLEGQRIPVPVDDDALHQLADITNGQFFKADTDQKLQQIYDRLGQQIGYETVHREVSKPFFAIGALLCLVAAGSALLISQRLP
ncbi:VWA domain-containing protein [Solihabitans fulvus]|uniref:VWA domain-containing protein n=1 Tax=Solihabitans fulvus TaxID=1892852 RepID=A0A5B2WQI1_9PSEU|nr:VWA domain-containing protein [Solihabitans fulvus]KAA2252699.1 VWA domain-containing protein [Solihabitans fulvus]